MTTLYQVFVPYIATYTPSTILTAFGDLFTSPSTVQVMPSPVVPSIVIVVIAVFIDSVISDTLISGVIAAASAPPQLYPALACDIQTRLGIPNYVPSFDLTAACTGLIYSLQVARGLIGSGLYKNILIVAADNNSRLVDWKDRGTSILFGDGAGAMVVTEAEDGVDDILSLDVRADGAIGQYISMNMPGENCPLVAPCDPVDSKIHMAGRDVYKFVVTTLPNYVDKSIEEAGMKAEDIDYLIPHQANQRIIEALQQRLKYPDEKVISNIKYYGNTSAASMIMHHITKIPLEDCIGRGTGLNDSQLQKKFEILSQANIFHGKIEDPKTILQTYGGFEIAQICGAMLVAYQHNMIILIDGFIATSALLIAQSLEPEIINNTIFCHNSNEVGHQKMLNYLEADPILHFDMRVGEGTGCALAYPLIKSAVVFLNEMASFESAGVSNKE